MTKQVAIDGPAGAGKSTIAKELAKKLGFVYVDTGAMYRALGIFFIDRGISGDDESAIESSLPEAKVTIAYEEGQQQVFLNGENVTGRLRTEEVGKMASQTSAYKAVRKALLDLQRDLANQENVIMDGRDIGSTVLPEAQVKIYLTASVECRGKRRYDELVKKGEAADFEVIKQDIEKRDHQDMTRKESPLVQCEDAVLVDSSEMNIQEVVEHIYAICQERFA